MRKEKSQKAKVKLVIAAAAAFFTAVILSVSGCSKEASKIKYIFMFIGDGMGVNQVKAAEEFFGRKMCFQEFPVIGLMNTDNINGDVTDSAAGITAMVSGKKTENGVIGKSADFTEEYPSIMEIAKEQGFATGIITTAPINHGTPAGFYAHVDSRESYDEIIDFIIDSSTVDFLGGGEPLLLEKSMDEVKNQAKSRGIQWLDKMEEIKGISAQTTLPVIAAISGKYSGAYMEAELDRVILEAKGEKTLSLGQLTRAGIAALEEQGKFFFAVESGMVDTACHDNDLGGAIWEVRALDYGVKEALKFAKAHMEETLIIVLADHETGGLSLLKGNDMSVFQKQTTSWFRKEFLEENKRNAALSGISFAQNWHSGQPVPVYAYGQGKEKFQGWYDNTEIFNYLMEIIGL